MKTKTILVALSSILMSCSQTNVDPTLDLSGRQTYQEIGIVRMLSIPQGGSATADICLLDSSGKPTNGLIGSVVYIQIDPSTLPSGLTATKGSIIGGASCGSVTFSANTAFDPASLPKAIKDIKVLGDLNIFGTSYGFFRGLIEATIVPAVNTPPMGGGTTPPPPGSTSTGNPGTLMVNIVGLPAGAMLETGLVISGNGLNETVRSTTTFRKLSPGTYTMVVPKLQRVPGLIVSTLLERQTPQDTVSATITATQGAMFTATYQQRTGTGALWFASQGDGRLNAYSAAQLSSAGGNLEPSTTLTQPGNTSNINALAFAPDGNMLWTNGTGQLLGFLPAKLTSAQGTAADTVSNAAGLNAISAMAFDRAGNLWVANPQSSLVVRISAGTLANPSSDVRITKVRSQGLAIDQAGNLWISDTLEKRIYKLPNAASFPAGTFNAATGEGGITYLLYGLGGGTAEGPKTDPQTSPPPTTTPTPPTTTPTPPTTTPTTPPTPTTPQAETETPGTGSSDHLGPTALAFDRSGNLYVLDTLFGQIVRIPVGDLNFSGNRTINANNYARIAGTNSTVTGMNSGSMAFDEWGSLWVVSDRGNNVDELVAFPTTWLSNGANNLAPVKRFTSPNIDVVNGGLAFNPTPCGLPLYGSKPCA